jgi:hypothetical protein
MNAVQSSKLNAYLDTLAVFEVYPEVANQPGLPAKLAVFSAKTGEIESLAQTQKQTTEGRTARRDELLEAMVHMTLDISGIVATVAHEQQLTELAQEVKVSRTAFMRLRRLHRPWLAGRVLDAAQTVLPQLGTYGVTAETLQTLEARIEAARQGLKQPRAAILARRSAGRKLIELFTEVDELLEEEIDRLVYPLRTTAVEFYSAYTSARSPIARPGDRGSDGEGAAKPVTGPVALPTPIIPSTATGAKAA